MVSEDTNMVSDFQRKGSEHFEAFHSGGEREDKSIAQHRFSNTDGPSGM